MLQQRALGRHMPCAAPHHRTTCRLHRAGPAPPRSEARPSIDPLAAVAQTSYTPGKVFRIHSPAELQSMLEHNLEKMVVLMAKASHCKPCKRFMPTYTRIAEVMHGSVFLEIIGDETAETKKMMMDLGIKVTPTFRIYRNAELVTIATGAKIPKVLPSLVDTLKAGEPGKELTQEELEESTTDEE